MNTLQMMSARQWAQLFGLGLALSILVVAALAVVLPVAALALALALTVAAAGLAGRQIGRAARAARATVIGEPAAEPAAQPALQLELADGSVLVARPVPLGGAGEHTMLLTRAGYLLVGDDGRVIHRLGEPRP